MDERSAELLERSDAFLQSIAANIRRFREQACLTQFELAERSGLDLRAVQRIESGGANFGVVYLAALAAALSVDPRKLLRPTKLERRTPGRPTRKRSETRGSS